MFNFFALGTILKNAIESYELFNKACIPTRSGAERGSSRTPLSCSVIFVFFRALRTACRHLISADDDETNLCGLMTEH
jgi:hypothetical protein